MPRRLHATCALLSLVTCAALAQPAPSESPAPPMEATEQAAVLERLADELETTFVFPEKGQAYAKMLRQGAKAGTYSTLTEPRAFATKVTADLQAVNADGHLKLQFEPKGARPPGPGQGPPPPPVMGDALAETKMIGDVAYLRFTHFPNDPRVAARARQFLLDRAGEAKAVVIDARDSRGGTVMIMDAILPLLFSERVTVMRMDTRMPPSARRPPGEPPPSMIAQTAPSGIVRFDHVVTPDATEKRLQQVPVFYLTNKVTRSAAEHFAMALQHKKRGRVVGGVTAGAGHFGAIRPMGERFSAFIPIGRSYDPETDRGWEATGITPDVVVEPAAALDEALKLAKGGKGAS